MHSKFDYGWYVWCVLSEYCLTFHPQLFMSQGLEHWHRESVSFRNDFRGMLMMGEEL